MRLCSAEDPRRGIWQGVVSHVLAKRLSVETVNIRAQILRRRKCPWWFSTQGSATALCFDGHFFVSLLVARYELRVFDWQVADPLDLEITFHKSRCNRDLISR
jgi:hypothetical protein